jgi:rRNA-processing protein FCF1
MIELIQGYTKVSRNVTWDVTSQRPFALVDTNAINDIADGRMDLEALSSFRCFMTTIQYEEICHTPDLIRRNQLLAAVRSTGLELIQTGVYVPKYSQIKYSKIGMGVLYQLAVQALEKDQGPSTAKRKHKSNVRDAILAETAIEEAMILVSNDSALRRIVNSWGGRAIDLRYRQM